MNLPHASEARLAAVWRRCHPGDAARDPGAVFAEVAAHYAEPTRHYHTLGHIDDCLARLDAVAALVENPDAVEIAIWFHDVIYATGLRRSIRFCPDSIERNRTSRPHC